MAVRIESLVRTLFGCGTGSTLRVVSTANHPLEVAARKVVLRRCTQGGSCWVRVDYWSQFEIYSVEVWILKRDGGVTCTSAWDPREEEK